MWVSTFFVPNFDHGRTKTKKQAEKEKKNLASHGLRRSEGSLSAQSSGPVHCKRLTSSPRLFRGFAEKNKHAD